MKTIRTSKKAAVLATALVGIGSMGMAQAAQAHSNGSSYNDRSYQSYSNDVRHDSNWNRNDRGYGNDRNSNRYSGRYDNRYDNNRYDNRYDNNRYDNSYDNNRYDNRYEGRRYDDRDNNGNGNKKLVAGLILGAIAGAVLSH